MCLLAMSQLQAEIIGGKIIFENETKVVRLDIPMSGIVPDYSSIQKRVKYYDEDGNKQIITPNQAREVSFVIGQEEIRMVSVNLTINLQLQAGGKRFLRLTVDGDKLKLLRFYDLTLQLRSTPQYQDILQKENHSKKVVDVRFRKEILAYFSDCPTLAKKIKDKKMTYKHLPAMVMYYNKSCK